MKSQDTYTYKYIGLFIAYHYQAIDYILPYIPKYDSCSELVVLTRVYKRSDFNGQVVILTLVLEYLTISIASTYGNILVRMPSMILSRHSIRDNFEGYLTGI